MQEAGGTNHHGLWLSSAPLAGTRIASGHWLLPVMGQPTGIARSAEEKAGRQEGTTSAQTQLRELQQHSYPR